VIPPFVDAAWLAEHRADVVLADVRWYLDGRSGRAEFEAGHLPGAVFVDLDRYLAASPGPDVGRHPLPDPETFAEGMGRAGIGDDSTVVAYDDAGGVVAARLVWLLRVLGVEARCWTVGSPQQAGGSRPARPMRRPLASPRGRGPRIGSRASMSCTRAAASCSTRATATASPASSNRSIRGRDTFPVPATCRRGRRSTPPDAYCRTTSCARSWPTPACPQTPRSSPRAARASMPVTRCS
jgi:rhodanese-related sulfurtransferase